MSYRAALECYSNYLDPHCDYFNLCVFIKRQTGKLFIKRRCNLCMKSELQFLLRQVKNTSTTKPELAVT